jgi:hypothetical protein
MPGFVAVLPHESLNLFEACDDTFLPWGTSALLLRWREIGKFFGQLVKIEVTHSAPLS